MLILKLTSPEGKVKYVCGAFPSACGKTNLAMLIPPEGYRRKGYKVWTVGDDIAWIKIGPDGRFYAQNPEAGFFGVAPGTNEKSNPNALACTREGTIFTNVVMTADGGVWWEGLDKNPPKGVPNWKGEYWDQAAGEKGAHPNSRFTAPARNCPCISPHWEDPQGVPLSAIIFGGRRAKTAPLVYQSRDWEHGVFVGSIMASETTAAAAGSVGVLRYDPMAMLPFCGYHYGDYFQHWLDLPASHPGAKMPRIYYVNWFRKGDDGRYLWPGFGDNARVLKWIFQRLDGSVPAVDTPVGRLPRPEDLDISGLDISPDDLRELLAVNPRDWLNDIPAMRAHYARFGDVLPATLRAQLDALEARLRAAL
jgi:phosphoenolpyruvate carboxykinase (GTP)